MNAEEYEKRLCAALGMTYPAKEHKCSNQPGILYLRQNGEPPEPVIFQDPDSVTPYVCHCEHEAYTVAADVLNEIAKIILLSRLLGGDSPGLPKPEDFMFIPEGAIPEIEPDNLSDAAAVISKVK